MRLMAEKGLEGVSLRSVNAAAGARNSSAAHYHFGNKLGLFSAVVEMFEQDVAAARKPLIEKLRIRSATEKLSAREIIEAAYGPFMGLLFHPEYGLPGLKFLSRLIVDSGPEVRLLANKFTGPLANEVLELLTQALPDLPPKVLKIRILFSLINLINGMSDVVALKMSPFGDMSPPDLLEAANYFIEYITAGISASPSSMTDSFITESGELIRRFRESGQEIDPSGA
jgi:AcrR family transcriptional regulator